MFDPEGPLWIQVVDPENGDESNDGAKKDNVDNENLNNAHKAKNNTEDEEELEKRAHVLDRKADEISFIRKDVIEAVKKAMEGCEVTEVARQRFQRVRRDSRSARKVCWY